MRYLMLALMVCIFGTLAAGSSPQQCPKTPQKNDPKQSAQMRDQNDTTDLFAIPLDSSEEEQNDELSRLDR